MPGVVVVQLPDGSSKELPRGATALDLAESIGRRLAKDAVAARLDGREVDLSTELPDGAVVSIVTSSSEEGRAVLRHSSATCSPRPCCGCGPAPTTPSAR